MGTSRVGTIEEGQREGDGMTLRDQAVGADASTAELINRAAAQVSTLVRDELALARAELTEKGRRAGVGAGLLSAAGVLALFGLALVITLAVVLLDLVWP